MTVQIEVKAETAAQLQAIAQALQLSLDEYLGKVIGLVSWSATPAPNEQSAATETRTPFELAQDSIGAIDSSVPDPAARPHDTLMGRLVAEKLRKQGLKLP